MPEKTRIVVGGDVAVCRKNLSAQWLSEGSVLSGVGGRHARSSCVINHLALALFGLNSAHHHSQMISTASHTYQAEPLPYRRASFSLSSFEANLLHMPTINDLPLELLEMIITELHNLHSGDRGDNQFIFLTRARVVSRIWNSTIRKLYGRDIKTYQRLLVDFNLCHVKYSPSDNVVDFNPSDNTHTVGIDEPARDTWCSLCRRLQLERLQQQLETGGTKRVTEGAGEDLRLTRAAESEMMKERMDVLTAARQLVSLAQSAEGKELHSQRAI